MAVLEQKTSQWLYAMRAYYATDSDVVVLCEWVEELLRQIERIEETYEKDKREPARDEDRADDEWSTGG